MSCHEVNQEHVQGRRALTASLLLGIGAFAMACTSQAPQAPQPEKVGVQSSRLTTTYVSGLCDLTETSADVASASQITNALFRYLMGAPSSVLDAGVRNDAVLMNALTDVQNHLSNGTWSLGTGPINGSIACGPYPYGQIQTYIIQPWSADCAANWYASCNTTCDPWNQLHDDLNAVILGLQNVYGDYMANIVAAYFSVWGLDPTSGLYDEWGCTTCTMGDPFCAGGGFWVDPSPAQLTQNLSATKGASAAATDALSGTPTTAWQWPTSYSTGGNFVGGESCASLAQTAGYTTSGNIQKNGSYSRCLCPTGGGC